MLVGVAQNVAKLKECLGEIYGKENNFEEIEKHLVDEHNYSPCNETWAWNFCCEHTWCDVCNNYIYQVI